MSDIELNRHLINKSKDLMKKINPKEEVKIDKYTPNNKLAIKKSTKILLWLDEHGYFDKVKKFETKIDTMEYTSFMVSKAIRETNFEESEDVEITDNQFDIHEKDN